MEFKKPRSGKLLELWKLLIANKGYSGEEIKKMAEDHNLGEWTGSNLLTHGVKHNYIILDDSTSRYYRSDSTFNLTKDTNIQTEETIQPMNTQIIKEELSQNWEQQKRVKDRYQTIITRKQEISQELRELEKEEKILTEKIVEFEQKIEQLIQRL